MIPFLLASLPTPRRGAPPSPTPLAFLETCRGFVTEGRLRDLSDLLGLPSPGHAFEGTASGAPRGPGSSDPATCGWWALEAQVDDAIVTARVLRSGRSRAPSLRSAPGHRVDVVEAVTRAFAAPDPGARERALVDLRWRLADELAAAAPDGFAALAARAVQVRLATRAASWDADAGWVRLQAALDALEDVS